MEIVASIHKFQRYFILKHGFAIHHFCISISRHNNAKMVVHQHIMEIQLIIHAKYVIKHVLIVHQVLALLAQVAIQIITDN